MRHGVSDCASQLFRTGLCSTEWAGEFVNRIKNDLQAQVIITHRWPRFSESLYTAIPALLSAA